LAGERARYLERAMIADPLLRSVVTALFVLSAAEMIYALATSHRSGTHVVSHVLHLVMAVAMAAMAWPRGAALPTTAPMVFFLLATMWFVGVALVGTGHRLVYGYHASMMLAMAWMYGVMSGKLTGPGASGASHVDASAMAPMASMPGMDMSETPHGSHGGGHPVYVDAVDWACTVGFAAAALWWLYRYFVQRKAEPAQPSHRFLGDASQAMMAAGMAIMFALML
jgi:hypothetical protein